MAGKKHSVCATLVRVALLTKGAESLSSKTRHTLSATLVWPRTGIAVRSYARAVELPGAERSYGEADWTDAVLFKETVQAPTALELQLTEPLRDDTISALLTAFAKAAVKRVADEAEDAVPFVGDLVAAPIDAFAGLLAKQADLVLGKGLLSLRTDADLATGVEREVPLFAPRAITVASTGSRSRSGPARRRTIVRAGERVGAVVIRFDPAE